MQSKLLQQLGLVTEERGQQRQAKRKADHSLAPTPASFLLQVPLRVLVSAGSGLPLSLGLQGRLSMFRQGPLLIMSASQDSEAGWSHICIEHMDKQASSPFKGRLLANMEVPFLTIKSARPGLGSSSWSVSTGRRSGIKPIGNQGNVRKCYLVESHHTAGKGTLHLFS